MYYAPLARRAISTRKFLRAIHTHINSHREQQLHTAADNLCRLLYEGECQLRFDLCCILAGVRL